MCCISEPMVGYSVLGRRLMPWFMFAVMASSRALSLRPQWEPCGARVGLFFFLFFTSPILLEVGVLQLVRAQRANELFHVSTKHARGVESGPLTLRGGQWRGPTANSSIYEVFCWAADESWTGEVRQQVSGFSYFQLVEVELLNRGKHLLCIIFGYIITSSFYISQPNTMWQLKIICKRQNKSISDSCHQVQRQLHRKWTGRWLSFYPAHLCSAKRYLWWLMSWGVMPCFWCIVHLLSAVI